MWSHKSIFWEGGGLGVWRGVCMKDEGCKTFLLLILKYLNLLDIFYDSLIHRLPGTCHTSSKVQFFPYESLYSFLLSVSICHLGLHHQRKIVEIPVWVISKLKAKTLVRNDIFTKVYMDCLCLLINTTLKLIIMGLSGEWKDHESFGERDMTVVE